MLGPTEFSSFVVLMEDGINKHQDKYRDTWRVVHPTFLENRLKLKIEEYELTKEKSKLISIANLAMLLHLRLEEVKQNGK